MIAGIVFGLLFTWLLVNLLIWHVSVHFIWPGEIKVPHTVDVAWGISMTANVFLLVLATIWTLVIASIKAG